MCRPSTNVLHVYPRVIHHQTNSFSSQLDHEFLRYLYWVGVHIKICLRTLYRYTIKALNKQDLSSQNKIKKIYSENRSPCFFFNYCQPCVIYYHKTTKTWLSYGNSKYISNEININLILINLSFFLTIQTYTPFKISCSAQVQAKTTLMWNISTVMLVYN